MLYSFSPAMQIPKFVFWFLLFHLIMSFCIAPLNAAKADVGVILDLDTTTGKVIKTCISMSIEDFYSKHKNYSTMIVPYFRDSGGDAVDAASAAIDLLKNTQVMAILGPQRSIQADFVIDIGDKVRVPIISTATSPALSPQESPYFIRSSWSSSSQSKAIAAIVEAFGWREVVLVSEDTKYGVGLMPFLTEELLKINAFISYQTFLPPSAGTDQILKELYILKTMQTRIFVVQIGSDFASHFFKMAKEAGMMGKGYAWITADMLTNLLDYLDSETIEAMQGVVGVKAYVPRSDELNNFVKRWSKRFNMENPDIDGTQLNAYGLWAYDSITALAEAIEHVGVPSQRFQKPVNRGNLTDLGAIGTSNTGTSLVRLVRNFTSKGLSGDFNIANGQLQAPAFEIVNVIGKREISTVGFWTKKYGISEQLNSTKKGNLAFVWPGKSGETPKGWENPTSGTKLRVGVPVKGGFNEFINVERDAETRAVIATGFTIDVFEEAIKSLPYAVPYEYVPFETSDGQSAGSYDDLVKQIYDQKFDAVVGDVTITAERLRYAEFSFPYAESAISAIVPIKNNIRKNAWIFVKPLTTGLWLTIGAFFVFTGLVVWVLEHRVNEEFRGPPLQQVGMIFWFSFSTLVFAHREKVISNLTRFVVIVWVFVVLVLTSSYTASLTSMLTAQKIQPTDIFDLIHNDNYVGYQNGAFVLGFLNTSMKIDSSKLKSYQTLEEYDEALSKGSGDGGVAAIVDELPYIKLLLSKYCHKYTLIGPTYRSTGLGFAFRKGSPLVPDVSTAILNLRQDEKMAKISRKWFGEERCSGDRSESLNLDNFKGLFLIAGISLSSSLLTFIFIFLFKNRRILASTSSMKLKLYGLATTFVHDKDDVSLPT